VHDEKQAVEEAVAKLHRRAGFTAPPLDLRKILTLRSDLVLTLGEEGTPLEIQADGDRLAIILPATEDPLEERMGLAHALGHAVLHAPPVLCEGAWPEEELALEDPGAAEDMLRESQAHAFALELLMPMELFEAHTEMRVTVFMKGQEVDTEVDRLVPIFLAPPEAVRARLHQLMERYFRLYSGRGFKGQ